MEIKWAEKAGFELDEMFGNWFIYQLNFRKKKHQVAYFFFIPTLFFTSTLC